MPIPAAVLSVFLCTSAPIPTCTNLCAFSITLYFSTNTNPHQPLCFQHYSVLQHQYQPAPTSVLSALLCTSAPIPTHTSLCAFSITALLCTNLHQPLCFQHYSVLQHQYQPTPTSVLSALLCTSAPIPTCTNLCAFSITLYFSTNTNPHQPLCFQHYSVLQHQYQPTPTSVLSALLQYQPTPTSVLSALQHYSVLQHQYQPAPTSVLSALLCTSAPIPTHTNLCAFSITLYFSTNTNPHLSVLTLHNQFSVGSATLEFPNRTMPTLTKLPTVWGKKG